LFVKQSEIKGDGFYIVIVNACDYTGIFAWRREPWTKLGVIPRRGGDDETPACTSVALVSETLFF
jgi:hypothetical protein